MEATSSGAVGAKPRSGWTDREIGFVLNFADLCLRDQMDFKRLVAAELSKFANREFTAIAIDSKIRKTLSQHCSAKYADLINKGTQSLDVRKLPGQVLEHMQPQRASWGLDELSTATESEGSAAKGSEDVVSGEVAGTRQPKRKASAMNGTDSQSYCETSISDSQVSSSEHALDSDFDTQPTKKKRKPNPPAGKQASKRHGSKAPARTTRVQAHPVQQQNDAQPTAATNPKKRKVAEADVIDLASASPPPSKRQALESTVERAHIGSKLPTADPTHPATQSTRDATEDSAPVSQYIGLPTTEELGGRSYGYTDCRPKPLQKTGTAPNQQTSAPVLEDVTARNMVKDVRDLIAVFLREQKASSGLTKEVEARLRNFQQSAAYRPGDLLDIMIRNIHSADAARLDMRSVLVDLIGDRDVAKKNIFPKASNIKAIDRSWIRIREHVRNSFNLEDYPCEPEAKPEDAGYVAARIDDLAKNSSTPKTESPRQFLEELLPHLECPHVVQSIIAALLCHWLFSGPEDMFHDVYSSKEIHLFESLLASNGPEEVQHFDKIGMKRLFEDPSFHESVVKNRATRLLADLELAMKEAWPDAPGFGACNSPQYWAEAALKLKQTLMINVNEYRIHYCMPGTPFDPTWMQAEHPEGYPLRDNEAETKKVAACLFPALSEHEPTPFDESPSLESVLVRNKKFFPTLAEKRAFDPKTVTSKATVLIL